MGHFAQQIGEKLLRRFAPARPDDMLTQDEMDALAPRINRLDRYGLLVLLAWAALFAVAFGLLMSRISETADVPPGTVFYAKGRNATAIWCMIGIVPGFGLAYLPIRMFTRWWMGPDIELHDRYEATKRGFDDRRAAPFVMLSLLAISGFICVGHWHSAPIVTSETIRFKPSLVGSVQRGYADVATVGYYERLEAPIGIRDVPNLEVTFDQGPPFRLSTEHGGPAPARLREIAEFIAERAGLEVTYQDVRR